MDRSRRTEPDPFLEWKVGLFFVGAILLLIGMVTEREPLALGAAVVLGIAAAIGLVDRIRRRRAEEQAWGPDEGEGTPE